MLISSCITRQPTRRKKWGKNEDGRGSGSPYYPLMDGEEEELHHVRISGHGTFLLRVTSWGVCLSYLLCPQLHAGSRLIDDFHWTG